jgi:hypothetical protein
MALVRKFGIGLGKRLILLDTAVNCIPNLSSEPVSGLTESFISSALTFRFAIVSSCPLPWGGSEELWAATALFLAGSGHEVHIFKTNVDRRHPRIARLLAAGCTVTDLLQHPPLRQRLLNRVLPHHRQYTQHQATQRILQQGLLRRRPQLTLVAQGSNFDGIGFADVCRRALDYPFVLLSQKAADIFFPPVDRAGGVPSLAYRAARHCYFVARGTTWSVPQHQLGLALNHASVVPNPFQCAVRRETALPWPSASDGRSAFGVRSPAGGTGQGARYYYCRCWRCPSGGSGPCTSPFLGAVAMSPPCEEMAESAAA